MKPWHGLWLGCAWLAACTEAPHDGVKLMPRAEPAAALATPWPAPAPALAAPVARASSPASAAGTAPALAPPVAALPWPGQTTPLQGDAVPPLVMPGEPTGNDDFRQALREKLERRAANP